jgi:hypothetical protein
MITGTSFDIKCQPPYNIKNDDDDDDDDDRYYMKTFQIISEVFIFMTFLENTVVRATTHPEIGTSSIDWP